MTLKGGLDSLNEDTTTINQANTISEINKLYYQAKSNFEKRTEASQNLKYHPAQKAFGAARVARQRSGNRNTLHALMSATKTLDNVKKDTENALQVAKKTFEIVKKNEKII